MDLSAVVAGMEPRLREMIGANITLQMNLEREGLCVQCDAGLIEQVVVTLITNARDAMPQGGTMNVETSRVVRSKGGESEFAQLPTMPDGNYVRLVVRDTGIGMDAYTRADCFSPFFTTKAKSIGLGLSTMYGIVTGNGGWVSLESEPGRGACFEIYLPEVGDPLSQARGFEMD
jgi:two-component system cell cycle sensor histidine kinase/response regulator CckA